MIFHHEFNIHARIKARVCNVVRKHILLYWVKWSCYPESSQYIMYSEKGTKNNQTSVAAAGLKKSWPIRAFRPNSMDWSDAFMSPSACSPPLSLPPPCMHTFHRCQKYSAHSSAEIQVAGEDIHLVTMAEKMQSALLVTAHPAKKAKKRKPEAEKAATK